ncbi:hypothetical protein BH11PAT2_BH11PAT2_06820 [soil metagenome]
MKTPSSKKVPFGIAEDCLNEVETNAENTYHRIPVSNAKALHSFLSTDRGAALLTTVNKGNELVHEGRLALPEVTNDEDLGYSHVPLGLILKGSVVVLKGGKGTKTLGVGDFIGLFETSDWLLTKHARQIGDWTLIANSDCEILFFGESTLLQKDAAASDFRMYLTELARTDHVPQPISSLPLLDWVASHTTRARLPDCAIVVHTHLLPNSFPFFRHLSHLVAPGRIFILEKPYSTIRSVFNNLVRSGYDVTQVHMEEGVPYEFATRKSVGVLWQKVIESQKKSGFRKLLIVDDGGDLWLSIPWDQLEGVQIVGVEQTQRGIARIEGTNHRTPPIISVASSGIKKIVEARFIGISVVKKLTEIGAITPTTRIGILGVGSIGSAVQDALKSIGKNALLYDPTYHAATTSLENAVSSIDMLLNKSDLIVGTVGMDSVVGTALERVSGSKVLASASSSDIEFGSLLQLAESSEDLYGDRVVHVHEDLDFKILNGGYPINFDRIKDSTPDEDIVLTRCLLYIGAMQAAYLLTTGSMDSRIYNLDKVSQAHLLEQWIEYKKELRQNCHLRRKDVVTIVSYSSLKTARETPTVWEK